MFFFTEFLFIFNALVAYPNSVSRLAVERIANGLIIEWAKPDRFITYWYLLSCKEKSVVSLLCKRSCIILLYLIVLFL